MQYGPIYSSPSPLDPHWELRCTKFCRKHV